MVGYSSSTGKYQASLHMLGKLVFLGEYKSHEEAEVAERRATSQSDELFRSSSTSFHIENKSSG